MLVFYSTHALSMFLVQSVFKKSFIAFSAEKSVKYRNDKITVWQGLTYKQIYNCKMLLASVS
jgi:hypothetical protein